MSLLIFNDYYFTWVHRTFSVIYYFFFFLIYELRTRAKNKNLKRPIYTILRIADPCKIKCKIWVILTKFNSLEYSNLEIIFQTPTQGSLVFILINSPKYIRLSYLHYWIMLTLVYLPIHSIEFYISSKYFNTPQLYSSHIYSIKHSISLLLIIDFCFCLIVGQSFDCTIRCL